MLTGSKIGKETGKRNRIYMAKPYNIVKLNKIKLKRISDEEGCFFKFPI